MSFFFLFSILKMLVKLLIHLVPREAIMGVNEALCSSSITLTDIKIIKCL